MFAIIFGYFTVILIVGCTVILNDVERMKKRIATIGDGSTNPESEHSTVSQEPYADDIHSIAPKSAD